MIFLGRNVLVEQDLTFDDIKPRLLGKEAEFSKHAEVSVLITFQVIGEPVQG